MMKRAVHAPSRRRGTGGETGLPCLLIAVLFLLIAGCDSPTDESWIRVKQFETSANKDTPITSLESVIIKISSYDYTDSGIAKKGWYEDGVAETDYVNVVLENQSASVGTGSAGGEGITVYKAHVSYSCSGYAFPNYDYPITLYIAPRSSSGTSTSTSGTTTSGTTTTGGQATLSNLALVPYELKSWLHEHLPSAVRESGFQAQAKVKFQARTDQGSELEADGALTVLFKNSSTNYSSSGLRVH